MNIITNSIKLVYLIIISNALWNCSIGPVVREGTLLTLSLDMNTIYFTLQMFPIKSWHTELDNLAP